ATSTAAPQRHLPSCGEPRMLCTEITESEEAFGHYVGHEEPQLNFYPAQPGSGNAMQYSFRLPGWVRQFDSRSCDATRWCAALTIDSLSRDPVAGQDLNATCANQVLGGIE